MKVLLLNGSPNANGCTFTALSEVEKVLRNHDIETELFQIGKKPVAGCIACRKCKEGAPCIFDDGVNELAARLDEFDAIVVGAPVYYAGPAGQATAFLDRLFYSAGKKLKGKPGAAVVSCRRGGASAAFDRLNKYFSINSMPIVTSQYWNQVHGNTPEEVLQDKEGLQTMRTLGENMAWLLRCIEAGKAAGVPSPNYEAPLHTNFIR
ncbi:MAG: flavodoxin family protein [Firmicutes bacterium]|nr:flavodoxin family protein [Bacillota bacterium]